MKPKKSSNLGACHGKKMRNSQPHHFLQNNLDKDLIQGQLPCHRSDRKASGIALPEIGLMKHHPVKSG